MMTAEQLLRKESEYIRQHKSLFSMEGTSVDENFFLARGCIKVQNRNLTPSLKHDLSKWRLTKFEMLVLLCFLGDLSDVFQRTSYLHLKSPIRQMCNALDTILLKSPIYIGINPLYRQCRRNDKKDLKKGEIISIKHYLNTSLDDWKQDGTKYIIQAKEVSSNARCLYKLRDKIKEHQVTFRRGTSFAVSDVVVENGQKHFYLTEI